MSVVQRFVYGRRRGHKLRKGRLQRLDELLPRLEIALPDEPAAVIEPLGWFAPGTREVWLEIGFGAGEHLAVQAEAHPEVGFIGCEPFINGVASLVQRVEEKGLGNVRIFADDARLLLHGLAPASIGRMFTLYPDPWPKTRHHKRRIVGPGTIGRFAAILKDDAELRLATDHPDYARWMLAHLTADPAFRWQARSPADWRERPDDWPVTRYEEKALRAGRRPFYFRFRRLARDAVAPGNGPDWP